MRTQFLSSCALGTGAAAVLTLVAYRLHFNTSSAGYLYLLLVITASVVWGFWEASVISLFALNCLNFFFVPPFFSFRIMDPHDLMALTAFEATALIVSRLSSRLKAKEQAEMHHRLELEKLYEFSRRILILDRRSNASSQIVALLGEVFGMDSAALFDASAACVYSSGTGAPEVEAVARAVYLQDNAQPAAVAGAQNRVVRLGTTSLGSIALRGPDLSGLTLDAIASLVAVALERSRSFERETRAEAARHAEQLRTAVLDALAHAFKSPLTAIRVASSGLLEAGRLDPGDLELARLIDERAGHLDHLATDLLQLARLDARDVSVRRERILVLDLVEAITARCREELDGRVVNLAGCDSGVELHADPEMLGIALEQFVDNATKYSDPGSVITIAAEEKLGEIVISVHNQGAPIAPADREHIFERFYRAADSRHRASGTGLGLSIVKKIAEAHGGRTWVESGEAGTTFFLAVSRGLKKREYESVAGQSAHR